MKRTYRIAKENTMSKTSFATIGIALILSATTFGQPQGKHHRNTPSGLSTEIQFPASEVKGTSASSNRKTGNVVKWEPGELDASSSSMRQKQNRQAPFDKGYLSPNAKVRQRR